MRNDSLGMGIKRTVCNRCRRPIKVCFCRNLTAIENHWPVFILQYFKEKKHPLNTAAIANIGLNNCQILLSNSTEYCAKQDELLGQRPLLIYPGDRSDPIESLALEKPRPLIFLDGTWRKTRRLLHESPKLAQLEKISFDTGLPSRYRIRKTPTANSLSTIESIVYVLSFVEKNPTKYQILLDTMDLMINKQIELMGEKVFKQNYRDCNCSIS